MSMRGTAKRREWGESRTKQSFADESDINKIVQRYTRTGQLTHIADGLMEFRDMSGIPDLHEAMNIVAEANSMFEELPAEIRKACGHDAGNFIAYVDDEENFDQCVEWGLLPPEEKKQADVDADLELERRGKGRIQPKVVGEKDEKTEGNTSEEPVAT